MQTNLFTTRPLTAHRLSAAVGSGKTRAAVAYMARPDTASRNFLYVAPTVRLLRQTSRNLADALVSSGSSRNVHTIHAGNATEQEDGTGARVQAMQTINAVQADAGEVVFLTTATFIEVLSSIRRPELWDVILDEAFDPVSFSTFELGADFVEGWQYLTRLFAIEQGEGARLIPRQGMEAAVRAVADGRFAAVGDMYRAQQDLAARAINPAMRCELVLNERVRAVLAGEPLPPKRKRKGSEDAEGTNRLDFASYVDPRFFAGFREVLFLSALFEETTLYLLWTRALGVEFRDHPDFPREMLRDVHGEQGRFLAVGHLLQEGDSATKDTLYRDPVTGQPYAAAGSRVLDRLLTTADSYIRARFGDDVPYLLQTNVGAEPTLTKNAVPIPPKAHGLNDYQEVHHVVALCVTNPKPQHLEWLADRTGLPKKRLTRAYRIHSIYQGLGRCSIRATRLASSPKTLLTAGKEDAAFIAELFPHSLWLGQVGSLPRVRQQGSGSTRPATKTDQEADRIRDYLAGIGGEVAEISSRRLRASLGSDLSGRSWTRAVGQACPAGSGWQLRGGMVERMTWDRLADT